MGHGQPGDFDLPYLLQVGGARKRQEGGCSVVMHEFQVSDPWALVGRSRPGDKLVKVGEGISAAAPIGIRGSVSCCG